MSFVASTLTEHIQHEAEMKGLREGEIKGKIEGRREGKLEGKLEGEISTLEILCYEGILSAEEFDKRVKPLRQKLKALLAREDENRQAESEQARKHPEENG